MKKIPTLFLRDADDMRHVTRDVHPDCQWVIDGEGAPTRKYDGTCVMYDGNRWWARREVKPGKAAPMDYSPVETDAVTGKTVGWEPIEQSSYAKVFARMMSPFFTPFMDRDDLSPGTYELIAAPSDPGFAVWSPDRERGVSLGRLREAVAQVIAAGAQ